MPSGDGSPWEGLSLRSFGRLGLTIIFEFDRAGSISSMVMTSALALNGRYRVVPLTFLRGDRVVRLKDERVLILFFN